MRFALKKQSKRKVRERERDLLHAVNFRVCLIFLCVEPTVYFLGSKILSYDSLDSCSRISRCLT
uniref:Uncharacterized protein n=1 Tax=Rhizophora mucronata TaxID=61149 RepID=A0A2P2QX30_RHIMU